MTGTLYVYQPFLVCGRKSAFIPEQRLFNPFYLGHKADCWPLFIERNKRLTAELNPVVGCSSASSDLLNNLLDPSTAFRKYFD